MNTKNLLHRVRRILMTISFLLMATIGAYAQNFFHFHNYSGDHLWSNPENWFERLKPTDETAEVGIHTDVIIDEDVDILKLGDSTHCNLTIQSGKKLTIRESISWSFGGEIILEDGAQLLHQEHYLAAKVLKKITAYNADTHRWNLIASPIIEDFTPSTENGLLTEQENSYALYAFKEENHSWINFKEESFSLSNGCGYLYANAFDTIITFSGNVKSCGVPAEIPLSNHHSNGNLAGYNVVGNPLPCQAFVNKSYYVLNKDSNALIAVPLSSNTPVAPCTGIIVKAEDENDVVTFSNMALQQSGNQGYIEITTAKSDAPQLVLDQALLSFNSDDDLGKFALFEGAPLVYFMKDNKELAILSINSTDMIPLKYMVEENGSYTLHFEFKELDLNYLHLFDNMTGTNIDLLSTPNYTFDANTNDYTSRFKLVFDPHYGVEEDCPSTSSGTFAYYADGNIVINDVETCQGASLQIVDMTGRVVIVCSDVARNVSTIGMTPGVYVLRLNDGNTIRTQKIVIE